MMISLVLVFANVQIILIYKYHRIHSYLSRKVENAKKKLGFDP